MASISEPTVGAIGCRFKAAQSCISLGLPSIALVLGDVCTFWALSRPRNYPPMGTPNTFDQVYSYSVKASIHYADTPIQGIAP